MIYLCFNGFDNNLNNTIFTYKELINGYYIYNFAANLGSYYKNYYYFYKNLKII